MQISMQNTGLEMNNLFLTQSWSEGEQYSVGFVLFEVNKTRTYVVH